MLKKRFFKTKDEVEVTFELDKNQWESIKIAGDFNDWQPEPMKLVKKAANLSSKHVYPKSNTSNFVISSMKLNGKTILKQMLTFQMALVATTALFAPLNKW